MGFVVTCPGWSFLILPSVHLRTISNSLTRPTIRPTMATASSGEIWMGFIVACSLHRVPEAAGCAPGHGGPEASLGHVCTEGNASRSTHLRVGHELSVRCLVGVDVLAGLVQGVQALLGGLHDLTESVQLTGLERLAAGRGLRGGEVL